MGADESSCLKGTVYRIFIFNKELPFGILSLNDYYAISNRFEYYCKRDGVSWIAVYSTTNGRTAEPTSEKNRGRGRPRKIVNGLKDPAHCHNLLLGNGGKSARSTAYDIKKSIDEYFKKKGIECKMCRVHSISDPKHIDNTIQYTFRQADIKRSGCYGFDFNKYYRILIESDIFFHKNNLKSKA